MIFYARSSIVKSVFNCHLSDVVLLFCLSNLKTLVYLDIYDWAMAWDFQQCGMCDKQKFRPACAYAQTDQSLYWSLKYSMTVKILTEPHLRFLSLKGGCTGSSESTPVKMPHCWKSRVMAHIFCCCYFRTWFISLIQMGLTGASRPSLKEKNTVNW